MTNVVDDRSRLVAGDGDEARTPGERAKQLVEAVGQVLGARRRTGTRPGEVRLGPRAAALADDGAVPCTDLAEV